LDRRAFSIGEEATPRSSVIRSWRSRPRVSLATESPGFSKMRKQARIKVKPCLVLPASESPIHIFNARNPPVCSLPKRRVQGVYKGCSPDVHQILGCTPDEHPLYTPCTRLDGGYGRAWNDIGWVNLGRFWLRGWFSEDLEGLGKEGECLGEPCFWSVGGPRIVRMLLSLRGSRRMDGRGGV